MTSSKEGYRPKNMQIEVNMKKPAYRFLFLTPDSAYDMLTAQGLVVRRELHRESGALYVVLLRRVKLQ